MRNRNTFLSLLLLAVLLTACGGAASPAAMTEKSDDVMMEGSDETMMEESDEAMMDKSDEAMAETGHDMEVPEGEAMAGEPEQVMERDGEMMSVPAWFGVSLTDASTGQPFSIDGFKGKVVLVETMAIWCSNCLKQQAQVKALHEALGERDDFVSIGLDIDPNEDASALKGYVESKGFDWYYAVPPADVSREIASLYGDQFLNPPSTPIVVIDRHGQAHPLPFGIKSADDLQQAIQPFLDESM